MTDYNVEFTFQKTIKVENVNREDVAIQKATEKLNDFLKDRETDLIQEMKITCVSRHDRIKNNNEKI